VTLRLPVALIALVVTLGLGLGPAADTAQAQTLYYTGGYYQANTVWVPGYTYQTVTTCCVPGYYRAYYTWVPTTCVVACPTCCASPCCCTPYCGTCCSSPCCCRPVCTYVAPAIVPCTTAVSVVHAVTVVPVMGCGCTPTVTVLR